MRVVLHYPSGGNRDLDLVLSLDIVIGSPSVAWEEFELWEKPQKGSQCSQLCTLADFTEHRFILYIPSQLSFNVPSQCRKGDFAIFKVLVNLHTNVFDFRSFLFVL